MAKLQKQVSRKVGSKEYSKFVVVIPEKAINEAKLKEGDKIIFKVRNRKITISKSE